MNEKELQNKVLDLWNNEEYSYNKIAATLGVTKETVQKIVEKGVMYKRAQLTIKKDWKEEVL